MTHEAGEVTRLLDRLRRGDADAAGELFEELYPELHRLAGAVFRSQSSRHTLQPTALVHETFLKMARPGAAWQDRAHFFAVAARAMRQILVNHARDRVAQKRGGGRRAERLTVVDPATDDGVPDTDVLAVHEALERLAALDARQARIAELRFFGGLKAKEAAEVLGVSLRTAELDWTMAKDRLGAWLRDEGDAETGRRGR